MVERNSLIERIRNRIRPLTPDIFFDEVLRLDEDTKDEVQSLLLEGKEVSVREGKIVEINPPRSEPDHS